MKRKIVEVEEDEEDIQEKFLCKYCPYETAVIEDLDEHLISHADETFDPLIEENAQHAFVYLEKKVPSKTKLKNDNDNDDDEGQIVYICQKDDCNYQTKRKGDLNKHILGHDSDEVMLYKCSECSYTTKRKCDMPKHLLTHCPGADLYNCPHCPYVTKRKNDLPKHILCHKGPEETEIYSCQHCEYATKRKGDLRKHVLTHSGGELLYNCTECVYVSKRQNDLHKHILVHSDRQIMGIFKCLKCEYATDKTNKFAKHVLSNCKVVDNCLGVQDSTSPLSVQHVQEYVIVDNDNIQSQVETGSLQFLNTESDATEGNQQEFIILNDAEILEHTEASNIGMKPEKHKRKKNKFMRVVKTGTSKSKEYLDTEDNIDDAKVIVMPEKYNEESD